MAPNLNVVGVVVADMTRSLDFYRRLGLGVPPGENDSPHVEHVLPGGTKITWDTEATIRSFDPEWTAPKEGGRIALAFECESPAEVDQLHDELVKAGYESHKAPWDAFWGQRYACVRDPDGNGVDLYAANAAPR
ncbi:VOC family protein [Dactylosporangium sp. AC04546]|uniref:VOC family protein n=1 Tax=Dactylosporangium sp. AC04546 TaxID=2862460 RepID=UPI001EDFEE87|nr:VOC family protein [Dactylosporangium sp. AC04546]WVK83451.1 VOC family protein [Dactylosporangium sp. AC04546]